MNDTIVEATNQTESIQLRCQPLDLTSDQWPVPGDVLKRAEEIENLSAIVTGTQGPLVFAIDAPWGGGKTTFIQLWRKYLLNNNQQSVYINAWESDFADDPLLPMYASLDDWLKTVNPIVQQGETWQKGKKIAGSIAKVGFKAAVKMATLGALDLDDAVETIAADTTAELTDSVVDEFSEQMSSLGVFKECISSVLTGLQNNQSNLVIFVDELDRCRPTYAIEVLERIKHLFDLDRVIFVLAINRDQLAKGFKGVYGAEFDADQYLRRFIDFDYQLKQPDVESYIRSRMYTDEISKFYESRRDDDQEHVVKTWSYLAQRYNLQLRDIDQLITRFRLIMASVGENQYLDGILLATLLVLRESDNALYSQYIDKPETVNDIISQILGEDVFTATKIPDQFSVMSAHLIIGIKGTFRDYSVIQTLLKPWKLRSEALAQESNINLEDKFDWVFRVVDQDRSNRFGSLIKLAYKRIELVNNLKF